ncbi:MAG: bifunctional riboflavin kinase/FAD synthetase [Paracoccaceae bacterium]
MRRIDGYPEPAADGPPPLAGASVAIGNFDGVHRGHQALVAAARAARPRAPLGVVTFEPHPRRVFQTDAPPFRLTTDAERERLIARLGVEALAVLPFDRRLMRLSPAAFARDVLVRGLGVTHVATGADFRFGRARLGDAEALRRLGLALGFTTTRLALVGDEHGQFSSTAAREAVAAGRMAEAAAILGRPHAVAGRVIEGDRRGRTLGYPTANLAFGEQIVPAYGVYAARVHVLDGPHAGAWEGVASIGERPTFGVNAPNFEVHLFDFAGDLYGAAISVGLVAFLRGEIAYPGAEALIAQMDRDSLDARRALAAEPPADPAPVALPGRTG